MEINVNLQGEKLKDKILDLITESKLPGIVVYYIIKDIDMEVESQYKILIANEKIQEGTYTVKKGSSNQEDSSKDGEGGSES